MQLEECLLTDEIFTHIADNGIVRNFNASAMFRKWQKTPCVRLIECEMDPEFVAFIRERRGVEQGKLDRLREPFLSIPVVGVEFPDGSTLTVDGHHRLVRLHERGDKTYRMIHFPLGTWGDFIVEVQGSLCPSLG